MSKGEESAEERGVAVWLGPAVGTGHFSWDGQERPKVTLAQEVARQQAP